MKKWLDYFENNRKQRLQIPWHESHELDPAALAAIVRSLQRFQVGESGEGTHLRRQAAQRGDPIYQSCIELFIREEQEHARLMAAFLGQVGAPLLTHHWTDACFIFLRHLFSLEQELLVLLVPEIIAKRYFRALKEGTAHLSAHRTETTGPLMAMCKQILHDEEGHVAFHVEYLQPIFAGWPLWKRIVTHVGWKLLFQAACLVVILDHRHALRSAGVSAAQFWWDCTLLCDEAAAAMFGSAATIRQAVPAEC